MGQVCGCQLMGGPLDVEASRRSVENLSYAAVVTFCSEVTGVRTLTISIDEGHALFKMFAVAEEAVNRWNANVALVLRTGEVMPGDVSMVIAVACDTAERAFACCHFVAESVSERVAIVCVPTDDA